MARREKGKKGKGTGKGLRSSSSSSSSSATNVSKLMEQGNLALQRAEPELAVKFFERALTCESNNTAIMDSLAEVLIQLNEPMRAFQLLSQSIQLDPNSNPCKYLYFAQLQKNHDALGSYQQGITLLNQQKMDPNSENHTLVDKQLSKAFCGIAELYLTDLCFDENAEQECEGAVAEALRLHASLDARHLQASLRISQNRMSEACDVLESIYQSLKQNREMLAQRTIIEELATTDRTEPCTEGEEDEIYSEELCITTAKMLIECSVLRPQLSRCAVDLLTALLEEDDDNIQLWYLAGVAELGAEGTPPESIDLEAAHYYLNHAKEMVEEIKKHSPGEPTLLEEELSLILHHLRLVEQMEAALPNPESVNRENVVEEKQLEEEWSDEEDMEITR